MRALAALAAAGAALAAAGCGVGAGEGPEGVSLRVTDDFGSRTVGTAELDRAPGNETAMRFLQREFDVTTRYGGGFVQSIGGLAGSAEGGGRDWFYYVNGIEAPRGAAATRLYPGDRVWWDRHPWQVAMRVPAVVGSFPEPFRSGIGGKRYPLRVECAPGPARACDAVADRLTAAGLTAARAGLGGTAGRDLLRVVVGPWAAIRSDAALEQIEQGPAASGVYVRPGRDGRALTLLDGEGRPAGTLGAGAGLVAATRLREQQPTWAVTGTDERGTLAAARALSQRALAGSFALAVAPDGTRRAVPR